MFTRDELRGFAADWQHQSEGEQIANLANPDTVLKLIGAISLIMLKSPDPDSAFGAAYIQAVDKLDKVDVFVATWENMPSHQMLYRWRKPDDYELALQANTAGKLELNKDVLTRCNSVVGEVRSTLDVSTIPAARSVEAIPPTDATRQTAIGVVQAARALLHESSSRPATRFPRHPDPRAKSKSPYACRRQCRIQLPPLTKKQPKDIRRRERGMTGLRLDKLSAIAKRYGVDIGDIIKRSNTERLTLYRSPERARGQIVGLLAAIDAQPDNDKAFDQLAVVERLLERYIFDGIFEVNDDLVKECKKCGEGIMQRICSGLGSRYDRPPAAALPPLSGSEAFGLDSPPVSPVSRRGTSFFGRSSISTVSTPSSYSSAGPFNLSESNNDGSNGPTNGR